MFDVGFNIQKKPYNIMNLHKIFVLATFQVRKLIPKETLVVQIIAFHDDFSKL